MPYFAVQNLSVLPCSHGATVDPRIPAKVPLSCYSRCVNTELHASKRTPWSLKRAPAIGLKKEGEMLFLHEKGSLAPPTGSNLDGGSLWRAQFIINIL